MTTLQACQENKIKISINNRTIHAKEDKNILEIALENDIFIPSLCYDPRLKPQGSCRVCLVEIEGFPETACACITKALPGMNIKTDTKHVRELVKLNLELIISDHPLDCMTCESCGNCMLQDLAYKYGIRENTFAGKVHSKKVLDDNPFIYRDNEKCILCGRCVRICDEVIGANAIGYVGRGFESEIVPAFDQALTRTDCVFCGNCISTCPVGALAPKPYLSKARDWETKKVKTVCPYCGVGCAINLHVKDNKIICVSSDIGKNLNQGNLCVKGRFGLDFVDNPARLVSPLIKDKNGKFKKIPWEKALDATAEKLKFFKSKYGPDSIGILSSAKCTNEENFLMSKFARAALGTNNIDHCARLCHASTVTGLIPTLGSGAMTNSIDDIKFCDTAIIIGSNTTEAHPVIGYEIIKNILANGLKLIVIDPRSIPITKYSKIHLKQKPGTDIAVLLGMMNIIYKSNLHNRDFINDRTENFDEFKKCFEEYTPEKVAQISGVDKDNLIEAAKMFASSKNASIFYAMGITQHSCGTDNVIAVADLSMMAGQIGRKGTGVNPLRGQNNVQGSCDMGALPNYYSGYQYVSDEMSREKFEKAWQAKLPQKAGLTLTEMMDGINAGRIKALYIMGENPMLSEPDLLHVASALKKLEFLAVQDIFITETAEFADIILPSACFAEKDGTFTNTERRVQLLRKAVNPPGEALSDWEIICRLSAKFGYPMNYESPGKIMDEIAGLTPAYGGISYDRLKNNTLQWPCRDSNDPGTKILHTINFSRGKGRFIEIKYAPPIENPGRQYPFILTTGRVLYQFHTRTMTGKVKGLNELAPMNRAHINIDDALELGINNNDIVNIESKRGSIAAAALVNDKIKQGVVFMPFHYIDSPANRLTNPVYDPKAKIPEFKACAVRISKK
jgi:formate dehydrogenase alpha subunit